jgi:hypothetical protein
MASGADVLNMLLPDGKFIITGNDYDSIVWFDENKVTRQQFEDGFENYDVFITNKLQNQKETKQSILDRLGITEDEARLLLS